MRSVVSTEAGVWCVPHQQ